MQHKVNPASNIVLGILCAFAFYRPLAISVKLTVFNTESNKQLGMPTFSNLHLLAIHAYTVNFLFIAGFDFTSCLYNQSALSHPCSNYGHLRTWL